MKLTILMSRYNIYAYLEILHETLMVARLCVIRVDSRPLISSKKLLR